MIEVPGKPDISKKTPGEVVTHPTRKKAFNVLENKPINTFLDKLCTDQTLRPLLGKELKQYPLFCELLQGDLTKERQKELLEKALQKQKEATENIDKEKLDRIAEQMQTVILMLAKEDPRISDVIMQRDTDKTTPQEKKEIFQTIINRFSEKFRVTPPKLYTDGITISGLGTSSFIKIDAKEMSIGQLIHEYTHYLQTQGKTSDQKRFKQSRQYYVLPQMEDQELKDLALQVYDESFMEQEVEYVRKKADVSNLNL